MVQTNVGLQLEMGGEIMVVGLYVVVGWVERCVWREWEARICHCDRIKVIISIPREALKNEGTCNHLLGRVRSCAIAGTVVFLGDVDTGLNRHLVACIKKRAGQC